MTQNTEDAGASLTDASRVQSLITELNWCIANGHAGPRTAQAIEHARAVIAALAPTAEQADKQDAGILRTLIHRTHACDLKFDKGGKVRALHAIFKVDSVPGFGMTEGVRRYIDAFMEDAALAAPAASTGDQA